LAPNAAPAWLAAGDWHFRASSKTDQHGRKVAADSMEKAVAAYRRAVQLYPNNAMYRARLAEACRASGDQREFRGEAEAALRLDDATPHTDKKLPADLRNRLLRGLPETR
jgi:tetratricopeptide (TPR) repeat protein